MPRLAPAAIAFALVGATLPAPSRAGAEAAAAPAAPGRHVATFAGGCFWCMEPPFEALPGVLDVVSGYTGGRVVNPSYEAVSSGRTGHAEAVQVTFDPSRVSYEQLLDVFWHNVDPTTANGQFCDHGEQYRSAIFTHGEEQRRKAESSRAALTSRRPFAGAIVTAIEPAGPFYPAEDYHQDYARKNPVRYKLYRSGCGRDARLEKLWGKAAAAH